MTLMGCVSKLPASIKFDIIIQLQHYLFIFGNVKIHVDCLQRTESFRKIVLAMFEIPILLFYLKKTRRCVSLFQDVFYQICANKKYNFRHKYADNIKEFQKKKKNWQLFQNKNTLWQCFEQYGFQILSNYFQNDCHHPVWKLFVLEAIKSKILPLCRISLTDYTCQMDFILHKSESCKSIAKNANLVSQRATVYADLAKKYASIAISLLAVFQN